MKHRALGNSGAVVSRAPRTEVVPYEPQAIAQRFRALMPAGS